MLRNYKGLSHVPLVKDEPSQRRQGPVVAHERGRLRWRDVAYRTRVVQPLSLDCRVPPPIDISRAEMQSSVCGIRHNDSTGRPSTPLVCSRRTRPSTCIGQRGSLSPGVQLRVGSHSKYCNSAFRGHSGIRTGESILLNPLSLVQGQPHRGVKILKPWGSSGGVKGHGDPS